MKGTRFLAFLLAFVMAFSSIGVADVSAAEVNTELDGNSGTTSGPNTTSGPSTPSGPNTPSEPNSDGATDSENVTVQISVRDEENDYSWIYHNEELEVDIETLDVPEGAKINVVLGEHQWVVDRKYNFYPFENDGLFGWKDENTVVLDGAKIHEKVQEIGEDSFGFRVEVISEGKIVGTPTWLFETRKVQVDVRDVENDESWIYNNEDLEVGIETVNVSDDAKLEVFVGWHQWFEDKPYEFHDFEDDSLFYFDEENRKIVLYGEEIYRKVQEEVPEELPDHIALRVKVTSIDGVDEHYIPTWWFGVRNAWMDIDYPLSDPGENQMLVGESLFVDPSMRSEGENNEYPQNEERWIDINDIRIDAQYAFTEDGEEWVEDGIIKIIPNEDGGWHLEGRDHGYAEITITYIDWFSGEEQEYPFKVYSVGDYYRLDLEYPDGTDCLLPGETKVVQTKVVRRELTDNGPQDVKVDNYTLEFAVGDDEFSSEHQTDAVLFEVDGTEIKITADKNNKWREEVYVRAYNWDEERGFDCGTIVSANVTEEYYTIMPDNIENVLVGEVVNFDDLIEIEQHGSSDACDYSFRLEYDDRIWESLSGNSLKRISPDGTDVNIVAYRDFIDEEENWEECGSRNYWFDELHYGVWVDNLSHGEYGVIYEDTELKLNVGNLGDKTTDKNVPELKFTFGLWSDENEELTAFEEEVQKTLFETVKNEAGGITAIKLNYAKLAELRDQGLFRDENWCDLLIEVKVGNYVAEATIHGIGVWDTCEDYQYKFGDDLYMNPGWDNGLDRWFNCYVENTNHPDGEDVEVEIVSATLSGNDLGVFWLEEWENGNGWQFGVHDGKFGDAELVIKHKLVDSEDTIEKVFNLHAVHDVWNLDLWTEQGTEDILTSGGELGLDTFIEHYYYDEEQQESHRDEEIDVMYEWGFVTEDGVKGFTITQDEQFPSYAHVITDGADENAEARIYVRVYAYNEENGVYSDEVAYKEISLWARESFYYLTPVEVYDDCEVGSRIHIRPELWYYSIDADPEWIEDARIWWGWDDNALKSIYGLKEEGEGRFCGQNEEVIFEVTGDWGTEIHLNANARDENGDYHDVCSRVLHLEDKNYEVWFNDIQGGDHGWIYEGENTTFEINTDNLYDKTNADLEVSFGRWNDETQEFEVFESVNPMFELDSYGYPASLTIYGDEMQAVLGENRGFEVRLQVLIDGQEYFERRYGMDLREPVMEYHTDWNDRSILPGWEIGIDRFFNTYREDSTFPHGNDEESYIFNVNFQQLEGEPGIFWLRPREDGSGWQFGADSYGADSYGVAKVIVTYYDVLANNYAQKSFLVDVVSDIWSIDFNIATDTNVVLVGDFNCVTANVVHERYTENGHEIVNTEEGYTYEWGLCGETDLFTIQEEDYPNKISVTPNPDLKPERYGEGHNIWCRVFYTDDRGETYEVAYNELWMTVQDIDYKVEVSSSTSTYELEEEFTLTPSLSANFINKETGKGDSEDVAKDGTEIYFVWDDIDTNAVMPVGVSKDEKSGKFYTCINVDGSKEATAKFVRLGGWRTDFQVKAYICNETGKYVEVSSKKIVLPELNYNIEFTDLRGGDHTWVFDNETSYELSVNTDNLVDKENYKNGKIALTWYLASGVEYDEEGHIVSAEYELQEGVDYQYKKVDGEYDYSTIVLNGNALSGRDLNEGTLSGNTVSGNTVSGNSIGNFEVFVALGSENMWYTEARTGIYVCEEEFELYNCGFDVLATNWDGWMYPNKQVTAYVRDMNYPYGKEVNFNIDSLEAVGDEDVFRITEESDPDHPEFGTYWRIIAQNIGSQVIKFNLTDPETGNQYTKEYECHSNDELYVMNVYTDPGYENMVPGSSKQISVEISHHKVVRDDEDNPIYDEDGVPVVDITVLSEEQYDLYFERYSDLVKVNYLGKITAGKEEGYTEVRVDASIREEDGSYIELSQMIGVNIVPVTTTMRANPLYVEPGDLVSINDVEVELYKEAVIGKDEEGNKIIERTDYNPRSLKFTHVRFDEHMQIVWLNKKLIINDELDHDFSEGALWSPIYISGKQGGVEYNCAVPVVICEGHEYEHVIEHATLTADGCTYDICTKCEHVKNYKTVYKASNITVSKTSFTYNTKAQKPTVTVKDSKGNTIANSNYTVTYSSGSTNAGSYTATVALKGDYSGSKTFTYKITAKKITPTITLSKTSFVYNGKVQTPTVTVKDGSTTLATSQYSVSYSSGRTNVGTYTVKVTLKANYSGTNSVTYKITAKKITPAVTLSKTSFIYNGKVQTPTVTVKDGSTKLAASQYSVSYSSGRANVGKYTVKVTMKGNYSGTKSVTYTIVPKTTAIYTPVAAKRGFTVKWIKQATQTTGYQIQYSLYSNFSGAKTVTIKGTSTVSKAITGLTGGKRYYVRIRTYRTTGGENYFSAWSAAKYVTTKK